MKKKWKIFLSIVLVLLLGTAGTAYYFFKVKEYDVADEKVEEIVDTEYDIVLPDGAPVSTAGNETASNSNGSGDNQNDPSKGNSTNSTSDNSDKNGSAQPSSPANPANPTGQDQQGSGSTSNSTTDQSTVTVASIKERYRPSFENLQSQANGKIDTLVSAAYQEFTTKKQNGESISFSYFYQKYAGAGQALEAKTDAAFQIIYKALQNELKNSGFSPSHADQFLDEYEAAKAQRESALLNKAKEAL